MDDKFDFETERQESAKEVEELTAKYRMVFLSSDVGIQVLSDILQLCHFGEALDPQKPAEVAEHHIGVLILNRCGIFTEGKMPEIVQALSGVSPGE